MLSKVSLQVKLLLLGLVLVLALGAAGCGKKAVAGQGDGTQASPVTAGADDKPDISAQPIPTQTKVTLYFGDKQAMYLVPEEREIEKGNETLAAVIIKELIKGPQKTDSVKTIPEGSKLLSVSVVDGVAYVNLSKEFKTKHWGGSAGESMTLYSIVNSLARLPDIEKVQFLLEGNKEESILGHADTTIPIEPNWNLVRE